MMEPVIQFGADICGDLDRALEREWLETNGIGGYASSTIAGVNTRRYHGLLVAVLPAGRFVLVSKLEETVKTGRAEYALCANVYPNAIFPAGFQFLKRFRLDPFPVFTFEVAGRRIEKRIAMAQGENTAVIEYVLVAGEACALEIRPLVAFRGYHELTHENAALSRAVDRGESRASIQPYAPLPRLYLSFTRGELTEHSDWYRSFVYPRERERGLDFEEDLFSPFVLTFEMKAGEPVRIVASTLPDRDATEMRSVFHRERARRSDAFLTKRLDGAATVIAGYHWFTDWGRDTMISLPGLTLATGQFETAKRILLEWTGALDQGMLPNRFPDAGTAPEYNTADAALWFFEAVRLYAKYSGDLATVRESLYKPLVSVIDWYTRGTRFGIRCDADGLVIAGGEGTQLTWMDAMVNGRPATPRHGKPVEIQALWYNALRTAAWFAGEFGERDAADEFEKRAMQVRESFAARFWNQAAGCLFDAIDQPASNAQIRPNQVIALSLGFPLVSGDQAKAVLAIIERDLLTPYGLRTLAPSDPQYRGRYEGGVAERDGAYHQGTVWPWLLGHFISAYLRNYGRAANWLEAFDAHMKEAGLGFVSEIFDGDAPHHPRGCIAQAWSVAEVLRARDKLAATAGFD